ncbi:MAG TPA: PKD domain-containing protein [Acidimicrobiales bacterium]
MPRVRGLAVAAVGLGLAGLGLSPATAGAGAGINALQVQAVVADQQCVNGDTVQVTLSAVTESSSTVRYRWDFNRDGVFDTGAVSDPTVIHNYPDEINVNAKVVARNAEGDKDKDSVSFSTLRCTN